MVGGTIITSFLVTVLTTIFARYVQNFFYTFVNKVKRVSIFIQNTFSYIYFMMEFQKIPTQIEA